MSVTLTTLATSPMTEVSVAAASIIRLSLALLMSTNAPKANLMIDITCQPKLRQDAFGLNSDVTTIKIAELDTKVTKQDVDISVKLVAFMKGKKNRQITVILYLRLKPEKIRKNQKNVLEKNQKKL